ncbi:PspC domain-containing protein [Sediminibacillus massiliensis]|uniref:PspC domain-containing protein n=1 Tax=Sediminibacillus massiliensis TaxID=1926277 RepID=UPI000988741B|nr:PspC domain-containing protein [Sediminibacillus massiliensis]
MRKLVRPRENRQLAGVIGGIAEYIHVDATLLRLVFVIGLVFTGVFPLLIIYILAAIIMPKERLK